MENNKRFSKITFTTKTRNIQIGADLFARYPFTSTGISEKRKRTLQPSCTKQTDDQYSHRKISLPLSSRENDKRLPPKKFSLADLPSDKKKNNKFNKFESILKCIKFPLSTQKSPSGLTGKQSKKKSRRKLKLIKNMIETLSRSKSRSRAGAHARHVSLGGSMHNINKHSFKIPKLDLDSKRSPSPALFQPSHMKPGMLSAEDRHHPRSARQNHLGIATGFYSARSRRPPLKSSNFQSQGVVAARRKSSKESNEVPSRSRKRRSYHRIKFDSARASDMIPGVTTRSKGKMRFEGKLTSCQNTHRYILLNQDKSVLREA